ncbi:hypothetical protein [Pyrococcus kukulkanii]|uniref:hypothetical protein n=1 Tax=Pyrococcus kukulkanii TaxID=1609559 RepID=UPI003564EE3B
MRISSLFLIALVILMVGCIGQEQTTTPSKFGEIDLKVELHYDKNNQYLARIEVTNIGNKTIRVARPIYFITVKYRLLKGNEELEFMGRVPTYLPLGNESVVDLKPGDSMSTEYRIDLCWWNVTKGEKYRLEVIYNTRGVASKDIDFWRGILKKEFEVEAKKSCQSSR